MAALACKEEEEIKIPVFTVIKNGVILKNIFILNHQQPPSPLPALAPVTAIKDGVIDQESEEIVIIGRHPNCNIVLMHPSISRFHLQLNLRPISQKLFVTDLSSVHGTWVSERKIEPNSRVELNEGDTIRVGGSTRTYRLHWVPPSHAYDTENPFVSALDLAVIKENYEECAALEEEDEVKMSQNERFMASENAVANENDSLQETGNKEETLQVARDINTVLVDNKETQLLDSIWEGVVSLFSGECCYRGEEEKQIQSLSSIPEEGNSSAFNNNSKIKGSPSLSDHELSVVVKEVICETKNHPRSKGRESSGTHDVTDFCMERIDNLMVTDTITNLSSSSVAEVQACLTTETFEETESLNSLRKDAEKTDNSTLRAESDHSFLIEDLPDANSGQVKEEKQTTEVIDGSYPMSEEGNPGNPSKSSEPNTDFLDKEKKQSLSRGSYGQTESAGFCTASLAIEVLEETKSQWLAREGTKEKSNASILAETDQSLLDNDLSDTKIYEVGEENQKQLVNVQPTYQEGNPQTLKASSDLNVLATLKVDYFGDQNTTPFLDNEENLSLPEEGHNQIECQDFSYVSIATESLPVGEVSLKTIATENLDDINVYQTNSEKKMSTPSIWSRRGKPAGVLNLQTHSSSRKRREAHSDDKVPWKDQDEVERTNRSISKALFSSPQSPEPFTPNKENYTPNTHYSKSLKSKSRLREIQNSNSCRSSSTKNSDSLSIKLDFDISNSSNKENQTPGILKQTPRLREIQKSDSLRSSPLKNSGSISTRLDFDIHNTSHKENQTPSALRQRKLAISSTKNFLLSEQEMVLKERRTERVPLQALFTNSAEKSMSDAWTPNPVCESTNSPVQKKINFSPVIVRKRWTMVVDTTSLLDGKSRKALWLLQGLKGTQLIIPLAVLRELDDLKSRSSLFRRKTEASLLLEWIEECMVQTKWWIHLQSSMEEEGSRLMESPPSASQSERLVPPAPHMNPSEKSPTAKDRILDYVLYYRKMHTEKQLVLLSNDVNLKIKAMEEGIACETAQEFGNSLVNPFSERFLWTESSPRGLTWSVSDDVVLKEKFYASPTKFSKEEGAKGLKIILPHNCHHENIRQPLNALSILKGILLQPLW